MLTYIVRRLLYSVPVLFAASFIVFILVTWKADPLAQIKMNPKLQPEDIARMVHEHNLDKPVVVRYGYWLHDAVTNKFGTHLLSASPVWPDIQRVLGHTLQLIIPAILIASLRRSWSASTQRFASTRRSTTRRRRSLSSDSRRRCSGWR